MQESKTWFEVDKDGFKELQLGKSKAYILRELIQNAWDENITKCSVKTRFDSDHYIARISVEDDAPEGFKDLRDSFTLFRHTDKRQDATKRGRFNIGEKQVIALSESAVIRTTKGTIIFDQNGRHTVEAKSPQGSIVTVHVPMFYRDYEEMLMSLEFYLTPKGIITLVNGTRLDYREPYKTFTANLQTEVEEKGVLKKTVRNTSVHVHKVANGQLRFLFEMGIPITSIDCQFSIDIQQKIPLNIDRETVSQAFLKDVFAEVLNATYQDVTPESSSQLWIREGTSDERIKTEAVKTVIEKRYGDKVVVANPLDRNSIDEAISHGYHVIYGSEMSKDEWSNIKKDDLLTSSSEMFGSTLATAKIIDHLTLGQIELKAFTQKIAKRLLDIELNVTFVESDATQQASYGNGTLTFNISRIPQRFFEDHLQALSLILHELGHYYGNHTEHSYHEALTDMAQRLVIIALTESTFFKED